MKGNAEIAMAIEQLTVDDVIRGDGILRRF